MNVIIKSPQTTGSLSKKYPSVGGYDIFSLSIYFTKIHSPLFRWKLNHEFMNLEILVGQEAYKMAVLHYLPTITLW